MTLNPDDAIVVDGKLLHAAGTARAATEKRQAGVGHEEDSFGGGGGGLAKRNLKLLVHGDDFVSTGSRKGLYWLKRMIDDRFEAKTTIVGHEKEDVHETRVLNRTIRATKDGWEVEADQRHAEVIVEMFNLGNAKEVLTLGEHRPWEEEERFGAELLDGPRETEFRGSSELSGTR